MESVTLKKPIISLKRLSLPALESGVGETEFAGGRKPEGVDVGRSVGAMPTEVVADNRPIVLSGLDSESEMSVSSTHSRGLWRKKTRRSGTIPLSSSDSDEPAAKTQAVEAPRSGAPYSTGKYIGFRKAQRELKAQKKEMARLRNELEFAESARTYLKSPVPPPNVKPMGETQEEKAVALEDLKECGRIIRMVVTKSGNLKGTFQKSLNAACETLQKFVAQPEFAAMARMEEEAKKWRELSSKLEAEKEEQAKENASLRRRLDQLEAASNARPADDSMERMEARIMARLEGAIHHLPPAPILRPPLAHEKKASSPQPQLSVAEFPPLPSAGKGKGKGKSAGPAEELAAKRPAASPPKAATPEAIAGPSTAPTPAVSGPPRPAKGAGKTKGKKKAAKERPSPPQPRPLPPAPATMEEPWTTVVKKGKKKRAPPAAGAAPAQQAKAKKEPKIRPPKSAAVVISLTPAAVAKGVTYAKVLTAAQGKMDLTGLGIDRLRPKHTATGAPMYEVPGANSEERADSLAARLREVFSGSEDVRVTRPTKFAELRVSGLDDAATPEIVAMALSRVGDCPVDSIRVGEVRPDRSGLGTAWAKLPSKAAQKIRAANRVLIGWVSARIQVLEPRPLRCFRCLNTGHVREQCDCGVDRSTLCFRCGKPGHKARGCEAAPHCPLCAAANKPAGHQLGSKACPASRNARRPPRRRPAATGATARPQPESPSQAEPVAMEIAQ